MGRAPGVDGQERHVTRAASWTLSPDEFAWLWTHLTGRDAYDYPDPLLVRETISTYEEYARATAGFREHYARDIDSGLRTAMRTLAAPDSRIRCYGSHIGGSQVRAVAARAGSEGVIAYQRTRTGDDTTAVRLTATDPGVIGLHIAAMLPPASAGKAGVLHGYTPRVRGAEPPTTWLRDQHGQLPADDRIRILMRQHRCAEGQFSIETGLRSDHPSLPRHLSWIDIDRGRSAGRYLVEVDDNDTHVTGVDPQTLARHLETSVRFGGRR